MADFLARVDVSEEVVVRGRFGIMAIHGGGLERTTDAVARAVAERSGSSYYGVLWPDDTDPAAHLRSTAFDPDHSEGLARFFAGVGVVGDSDLDAELAETRSKFRAMLGALIRP